MEMQGQGSPPHRTEGGGTSPVVSLESTPVLRASADASLNFTGRHRRSTSINSGFSSLTSSLAPPSNGAVPYGLNRINSGSSILGPNGISEIVDGTSSAGSSRHDESPAMGRKSTSTRGAPITYQSSSGGSSSIPFKPPTHKEIPPVTLTKIPKIAKDEFTKYLQEITEEYDTFHGIKYANGVIGDEQLSVVSKPYGAGDDLASVISASMSNLSFSHDDANNSTANPSRLSVSNDADLDSSMISVAGAANTEHQPDITPLSTVPEVFFEENFQLDKPRVFDVVIGSSPLAAPTLTVTKHDNDDNNHTANGIGALINGVSESSGNDRAISLFNSSILQEKLSWYIDTVELHLIKEISNASTTFFSALNDLKDIKKRTSQCIARVEKIQNSLQAVDQKMAVPGIKYLKLRQRRTNVAKLAQTIKQVAIVLERADEAELILHEKNDPALCIDMVDALEALLVGKLDEHNIVEKWITDFEFPLSDLRSVKGLSLVRENLVVLRTRAGESYADTFANILVNDLSTHVASVPSADTMNRLASFIEKRTKASVSGNQDVVNTSYLEISGDVRTQLEAILGGLVRSDNISNAIRLYRERSIREVKNLVRIHLPTRSDSDATSTLSNSTASRSNTEKSSGLAQGLKEMSVFEVEKMLYEIYSSSSEFFRRLITQQKLLLDLVSSIKDAPPSMSTMEINEILNSAVSITETRMSKVLKVRREQVGDMDMQSFLNYYSLNGMFISECEALCGDPCAELSQTLAMQIKLFISNYHNKQDKDLSERMEKDAWREVEVPSEFQDTVDRIVESANSDPSSWTALIKNILQPNYFDSQQENNTNPNALSSTATNATSSTKKRPRNVFVESDSFIIANSAIFTINIVEKYLQVIVLLPHLTGSLSVNITKIVRSFNSLTTQLILGAGATRSAGLKHITAKHLSLASESLNFVATMIGYIRKCIVRHMNVTSAQGDSTMKDLERVVNDMEDHQREIHQKFILLMSDKMDSHSKAIAKVNWTEPLPDSEPGHKYMQSLVKETAVLTKILKSILPKATSLLITSKIFDIYEKKLLEAYRSLNISSATEKDAILKDLQLFKDKLGQIEGSGSIADVLISSIEDIQVAEAESVFDAGDAHITGKAPAFTPAQREATESSKSPEAPQQSDTVDTGTDTEPRGGGSTGLDEDALGDVQEKDQDQVPAEEPTREASSNGDNGIGNVTADETQDLNADEAVAESTSGLEIEEEKTEGTTTDSTEAVTTKKETVSPEPTESESTEPEHDDSESTANADKPVAEVDADTTTGDENAVKEDSSSSLSS